MPSLTRTQAARHLGVSPKALLVWERRGLLSPERTTAGWRVYSDETLARGERIARLRRLGLSLLTIDGLLNTQGPRPPPSRCASLGPGAVRCSNSLSWPALPG